MVYTYATLQSALLSINEYGNSPVVTFSPDGQLMDQSLLKSICKCDQITLICSRYEGIDDRFIDKYVTNSISIGNYVLSNGEIPAMVFIDALLRMFYLKEKNLSE